MKPDRKVCDLTAALKRIGGNVAILDQLAAYCRDDLPDLLSRLHAAVAADDPLRVQFAAHSIKGLVVNFGADAAALAAQRIEQMAELGDLSRAAEVVNDLESALAELKMELALELAKL
jgi:HPt (histidine-containing phosphotransfer) domain-containing protein